MKIQFANSKVKKTCNKATGKLERRLNDISAAENMQEMKTLPGKLHVLKGDRKGQWAMDVNHPKRLIMEPLADPMPMNEDGWIYLEKVTAVRIIAVEDYHG